MHKNLPLHTLSKKVSTHTFHSSLALRLCLYSLVLFMSSCSKRPTQLQGRMYQKTRRQNLASEPVKVIHAHNNPQGIHITWHPYSNSHADKLIRYNIYRFTPETFIPICPHNEEPLETNSFLDRDVKSNTIYCYIVKAVYIQENNAETPASRILHATFQNKR